MTVLSPARQQYLDLKQSQPDAILLYRLGDFYEMFDQDAEIASRILGIQLTARSYPRGEGRVPMAGVPHHSVHGYIKRLLDAGHRVALCEQMTEAGKGLVERDVVRVFTPGTLVEPDMIQSGENNFLCAAHEGKTCIGLAHVDVTTGEFAAAEFEGPTGTAMLEAELLRLRPAEVLIPEGQLAPLELPASTVRASARGHPVDPAAGRELLLRVLGTGSLAGFGLEDRPTATVAAGHVVAYLNETNSAALALIDGVRFYTTDDFMVLDRYTRTSLELTPRPGETGHQWTLLRVLDRTKTRMGARALRSLIGRPSLDITEIDAKLDVVAALAAAPVILHLIGDRLARIGDIERIAGRIVQGRATPADLTTLRSSLDETDQIRTLLAEKLPDLGLLIQSLHGLPEIVSLIDRAVDMDGGRTIKPGFNQDLDDLRAGVTDAREAIARIERREVERTGIKGLRVGYNKVFGYYIEVPKGSVRLVPEHYVGLQTLLNGARYFTPDLKEYESKVVGSRDQAEELERRLFIDILGEAAARQEAIMATAGALAKLDVFRSLADVAVTLGYVRPVLDESPCLELIQARHPVVEAASNGEPFVPNDCRFDAEERIFILTGPNMGGKSTTLRTVALIVLMAQIGSFVPAASARIGIVDRIFSRVGAQDDIAAGQSTFMTEMVETSNILRHATARSLLILDEIGRGTSTYDGLAIARAVIEYIHARVGARTLFATHYHELTALEGDLAHVRNFHMAVADHEGKVIFLHRMTRGGADQSYGIHVARLAGLPHSVTVRAERILRRLERSAAGAKPPAGPQLALFDDPDLVPKTESEAVAIRILDQLLALDLPNTTPLEALERLHRFQEEGRSSA